ncbi:MAG TPA: LysE family transporter [Thermoplasmata archaeon]|nr:LysE family transporter [Thermoplasmata archaeon]
MGVLESLGFGAALGFSLTVPPGPMNALIAARAARSFRAAVLTGLGAMTADAILAAVVFSLVQFVDLAPVVRPLDAVGAVVMAYFGVRILRSTRAPPAPPPSDARTFSLGVGVGVANPFQVAWWLTAGLAFARFGGPVLLAGLFGAILVWVLAFPFALSAGARRSPRIARYISIASAAIMFAFAAYLAILAL